MSKHIIVNSAAIRKKLDGITSPDVKTFAAESFYKEMFQYIPFVTGTHAESVDISEGRIEFFQPGSKYLYYGKLMVDPETGSAYARAGTKKVLTDKNLSFDKSKHKLATSYWDRHVDKEKVANAIGEYIRRRKHNG